MKWTKLLPLFALVASALAQTALHSGSTVYIEPMDGYETYLAAALAQKHVPVIVLMDRNKADFILTSTVAHNSLGGNPAVVISNRNTAVGIGNASGSSPGESLQDSMEQGYEAGAARKLAMGETSASIAIVDPITSRVIFAYSADKMGTHQLQKNAEDCAKHLKEFIEKSEKEKK